MIRVFFGSPGSGKTTLACYQFSKLQKRDRKLQRSQRSPRYDYYFSNFSNDLSKKCILSGLGLWTFPEHSYIIIDEAGIEYNSRKYKELPQETIGWFKLHRHYKCDVDFISQSWDDMDITIRRLADELWYIKKFGPISLIRRVYKTVTVDKTTRQIIDAYDFGKLLKRFVPPPFYQRTWFIVWRPRYYKYFNTFERINRPVQYFGYPRIESAAQSNNIPLNAIPGDGRDESLGDVPDPAGSDHVGAGSPGALARRWTVDLFFNDLIDRLAKTITKSSSRTK